MQPKHGINRHLSLPRYRYRPVLGVLLLPSLLLIGVFSYYPAVRSLIGGFYQWNGFSPPTYAGVSQFKEYLQSPTFGTEAKNLAILVGGSVLITLVSQFTAAEIVIAPAAAGWRRRQVPARAADRAAAAGAHRGLGVPVPAAVPG